MLDQPAPEAVAQGLRLATALAWFWMLRGHRREYRTWLDRVLALPAAGVSAADRADALALAGAAAALLGDAAAARARWEAFAALAATTDLRPAAGAGRLFAQLLVDDAPPEEAARWLAQRLALFRQAGDRSGEAVTLWALGRLAREQGDLAAARRAFEASLTLFRGLGNRNREAAALNGLGTLRRDAGDAPGSRPFHEAALAIWQEVGYENGVAGALNGLGEIALATGAPEQAAAYFAESLERFRATDDRSNAALVLRNLALLARATGDPAAARARLAEAFALWRAIGRGDRVAETAEMLAGLAVDAGAPGPALRLAGAAAAARAAADRPLPPRRRARLAARLRPASRALGAGAAAAQAQGRRMTPQQAVAEFLRGGPLAHAAPAQDRAAPGGPAPPAAGPLRVDGRTYTVWRGERPLPRPLAAREFALLQHLYELAGRVCPSQELGDAVWGPDRWDPAMLYRLVRRVREKVEPHPVRPRYLLNVPGFGYRLAP